ncbi:MAG: biosynthetic-type acetolactate synthase large subunit [Clostridiales bacterium]|nr:biosynthetic-type acetolactate synthase large subunit [Clostridiales bacterium]
MKLLGSEAVMKILLENHVDTVFGYPGGAALFLYDELYKYEDKIKHVLSAHEQGASHAADGYARSTGKTGVVIATSGPGATNLVTGIATAYMDSVPMVIITANVANNFIGRDAFQETCITGITFPITKHSYFVNKPEELADAMRNAFRIANEGRKGPVLVDITKDVTAAEVDYVEEEPYDTAKYVDEAIDKKSKKFAKLINEAKKPVFYLGGGIVASGASDEVRAFMDRAQIPAVNSMMASGVVEHDGKYFYGMLGMHGSYAANKCIAEADLVVAIGTRFSDRVALNPKRFAENAKVIQIDIDKSEVNKNVMVVESIIGDCKEVLQGILPMVKEAEHGDWIKTIEKWSKEHPLKMKSEGDLCPQDVIEEACRMAGEEAFYVTDVGQHQMWAAQYVLHKKPRHFLSSGGLGTMGFGYGAAIGAQIGNPGNKVVHFTGDGSLHMNLNEACTAVSNELPVITVIMNNRVLGMVYQWQTDFYGGRHSHTVPERKTDFCKVIEAFGGTGYSAENIEEFKDAFQKALKAKGPVWIDCDIVSRQKALPMIPNGHTVEDSIFE